MRTVFHNGRLFDGHAYRGRAGAVVVDDGVITAVGGPAPRGDRVVDLAGGLLTPGFTDAHVHAVQGGLERLRCDLTGVAENEARYLAAIESYAHATPHVAWILGGGWAMAAFPGGTPTAAALDRVVGDRPVFLPNRDHHGAWVNSLALRHAGITRDTPDPVDGRIERDADGEPTGTLHEGAMKLVTDHLPPTSPAELRQGLLAGQRYLHSVGVTGWQDAIVGAYAGMDDNGPAYARAGASGELVSHVVGALWWDRDRGAEQLPELVERRAALRAGRFAATAVKIMQDGVIENGTAALTAPYLDRLGRPTTNAGRSFVEPSLLRTYVHQLDQQGFQVHVHGLGDRAVREALDAFAGTSTARRHHIAHVQLVHPSDIDRFAQLGVTATIQALWAQMEDQLTELTLPFLGAERAGRQYPFGSLHRAGAHLAAGSDWPVTTADPLAAIHVAVNRSEDGAPAFLPEQRLPLLVALRAYTSGSAWLNHRPGTIAVGRAADLVVLDRDPFDDPLSVGAARVVSTWIDGTPVYAA